MHWRIKPITVFSHLKKKNPKTRNILVYPHNIAKLFLNKTVYLFEAPHMQSWKRGGSMLHLLEVPVWCTDVSHSVPFGQEKQGDLSQKAVSVTRFFLHWYIKYQIMTSGNFPGSLPSSKWVYDSATCITSGL